MKHIGIVGVTAEGASLCYKTICEEATKLLGQYIHPEISLHNHSFSRIFEAQNKGDWKTVAALLLDSITKLHASGAEFAIIPANSVHYCFEEIREKSPIPLLSIVEITVKECKKQNYKKVGVLGTVLTMKNGLYKEPLESQGIEYIVPNQNEQSIINKIIFDEIITNKIANEGVAAMINVIQALKSQSCDALILGCTEIPIIINKKNSPLPLIDTTRLLAKKALEYALK